ncbi:hypothetical protein KCP74_11910 [Salmonella enterica subsp. enterica]|nr:hypothetical protein KCP74_11910 [Salmonella enterica subsp. enterica]
MALTAVILTDRRRTTPCNNYHGNGRALYLGVFCWKRRSASRTARSVSAQPLMK